MKSIYILVTVAMLGLGVGNAFAQSDAGENLVDVDKVTLHGEDNITIDVGILPPEPGTNSVGDFVWLDENANGTQDEDEPGIPNVRVLLCYKIGELPVCKETRTDQAGHYLFNNLRDGDYEVKLDWSSLPEGLGGLTEPHQGNNIEKDSNADRKTAT